MLSNPTTCREERLNFSFERTSAMACVMQSQPAIAEWQQGHPDWQVKQWRCAAPGTLSIPT
jgi:hypothetical protein